MRKIFIIIILISIYSCSKEQNVADYSGTTITIMAEESFINSFKEISEEFTKKYNAEVGFQIGDFNKVSEVVNSGNKENFPDLFLIPHDRVGSYVSLGVIKPISPLEKAENIPSGAIEGFTYKGELYGIPLTTENLALYRNPLLVPHEPENLDNMIEIGSKLVSEGKVSYGISVQETDAYQFFPILSAFGGYVFKSTANGLDVNDIGIATTQGLNAGKWLEKQYKNNTIPSNLDYNGLLDTFTSGESPMLIQGPWALNQIKESGIPYEISPIPGNSGNANPFLGVIGLVLSANSKNDIAIQTFVNEYITTELGMHIIFEHTNRIPVLKSISESLIDPDLRSFAEAGKNGIPMPNVPEVQYYWSEFGTALSEIANGDKDAEQAFIEASVRMKNSIKN